MSFSHPSKLLACIAVAFFLGGCSLKSGGSASYQTALKPTSGSDSANPATEFRIVMGTRYMVSSTLDDIFGRETAATGGIKIKDVTSSFVLNQTTSWGGSCDPYANSLPVPHALQNGGVDNIIEVPSVRGCTASFDSQASALPTGSTSRLAWTVRACDRIVSSDAAVQSAATQAGIGGGLLSTPPDENLIRSAFDLFHPGMELSGPAYSELKNVVDEANRQFPNSPESWRFLLLTLCTTPGWQML